MSNSPSSPSARMYPSMCPSPARWTVLCVPSVERPGRGDMWRRGGGEGEAGSSDCEMCLPSEIQLLSSAPLLAASYSLSFCFSISPSRSTHSRLLLHGNHLLVSLSRSAASVIHNIRPPRQPTPLLSHRSDNRTDAAEQARKSSPYSVPPSLPPPKCDRNLEARPA